MNLKKLMIPLLVISFVVISSAQDPGTLKWDFWTSRVYVGSPAMGPDGMVVIGSYNGNVYAFKTNGQTKWIYRIKREPSTSPAIAADGTVYIGATDSMLYAISSKGLKKWTFKTGNEIFGDPTLGSDGTIYFSTSNTFYAVDSQGNQKWKFQGGRNSAIGKDGTIYVTTNSGLTALHSDGTVKWSSPLEKGCWTCPAIDPNGTIYVVSEETLNAIDTYGDLLWSFYAPYTMYASPVIGSEGTIYVGTASGAFDGKPDMFYAINPQGEEVCSMEMEGQVLESAVVGEDGTVYCADQINLYANTYDLNFEKWRFSISDPMTMGSPVLSKEGTLYFGVTDGHFYALNSGSHGLAENAWPRFHHDNSNSGNTNWINTDGVEIRPAAVHDFNLQQNYPNPFNPKTTLSFHLPRKMFVTLTIHDLNGRLIATLLNQPLSEGEHEVDWEPADLASGVYLYTLEGAGLYETQKMVFQK